MVDINPEALVKNHKNKAKAILEDKDKLQKLLHDAAKKAEDMEGPIEKVFRELKLLMALITDYISGNYRVVPYGSLVMIVVAILYFVSPIDLIPDFIAGAGYIDDVAVIAFVVKQIDSDLQKFKAWKDVS